MALSKHTCVMPSYMRRACCMVCFGHPYRPGMLLFRFLSKRAVDSLNGPGGGKRSSGLADCALYAFSSTSPIIWSTMLSMRGRWKGPLKVLPLVEGMVGLPSRRR